MLYKTQTRKPIEDVIRDLTDSITRRAFSVLATHDLKAKMESKGISFSPACRILEVCNPEQAKRALEGRMDVSTALPCRISVYEEDDEVHMATLLPTVLVGMFREPDLAPVAEEVEQVIVASMDETAALASSIPSGGSES